MSWEDKEIQNKFRALSPIIDDEKQKKDLAHYYNALSFALSDDQPRIRNIAVTGDYGSGKSTVIESYINTAELTDKTVTISFATFNLKHDKEHRESKNADNKVDETADEKSIKKSEQERQDDKDIKKLEHERQDVEISILQQLIYHERAIKLPLSRFKRIHRRTSKEFFWNIGFLIVFLSAFIAIYFSLNDYFEWKTLPRIIFGAIFIILALVLSNLTILKKIYSGYYFLGKVNLTRGEFAIKDQEDKSPKESLLNIYLDEIVYFFDVTDYQYVVIEDLDRIEHVDIFVKLREINQIINVSRKNKKNENDLGSGDVERMPVKFIYAVKDTLFLKPEDRTKFFDFIIPIIPVLDYQNRQTLLETELERLNLKINLSPRMLLDLSDFVTDMRILRNIVNELAIYIQKNSSQNKVFDVNKILPLIVYKNLMPLDFSLLREGKGILCTIVRDYRNNSLHKNIINKRLERKDKEISEVSTDKEKEDLLKESENIKNNLFRKDALLKDILLKLNKEELEQLFFNDGEETYILQLCLTKGYINHTYMDYLSLSHGIEQEIIDYRSAINRNTSMERAFNLPLKNNEGKFLWQADLQYDFKLKAILNFDLIKYLVENYYRYNFPDDFKKFWNNIRSYHFEIIDEDAYQFLQLFHNNSDFKTTSNLIDYVFNYLDDTEKSVQSFISLLQKDEKEESRKTSLKIFWHMLSRLRSFRISSFKNYMPIINLIESNSEIVNTFNQISFIDNLLKVFDKLDFKIQLELPEEDQVNAEELFSFLYKKNKYSLNIKNIEVLFNFYELYEELQKANLSSIKKYPDKLESLLAYIDSNIETYVNDVYLELEGNIEEDIDTILYLLNHKDLSLDLKRQVIAKQSFMIDDLESLENSEKLSNFLASDEENEDE